VYRKQRAACRYPARARSQPGQGPILASGAGDASRARAGQHGGYRREACLPDFCAQACGSLVQKGRQACVHAVEMPGIPLSGASMTGPSPGRARFTPCAYGENGNCPHAMPQYLIKEPKLYPKFIFLLFRVGTVKRLKPRDGEPGRLKGRASATAAHAHRGDSGRSLTTGVFPAPACDSGPGRTPPTRAAPPESARQEPAAADRSVILVRCLSRGQVTCSCTVLTTGKDGRAWI
jgi:hypothetical protein